MNASDFRIARVRKDYNRLVVDEMMEDHALRFAPRSFRKWSEFSIANTTLGSVSFLALEVIGATLMLRFGFINTLWAVLLSSLLIFLASLPVAYYAARDGVDIDLLTRGSGFGYLGSTLCSLIYACFSFLFMALEAAVMAQALTLFFPLSLSVAYIVCVLGIIPLTIYGITLIGRVQRWSTPIYLVLFFLPLLCIAWKEPSLLNDWLMFAGSGGDHGGFDPLAVGSGMMLILVLLMQIGEQVDFLRFMPEKMFRNRWRWWGAVIAGGPGWVIPGCFKLLTGAFLAYLVLQHGGSAQEATSPSQMYLQAYHYVVDLPALALGLVVAFIVLSQVKINLANAYTGSLAWSNFFARVTHSHPGRVVWLVFNVLIALALTELGVFDVIDQVLLFYANIVVAWMGALVADLVINKPLGWSPAHTEFRRAYLYDVNPVGVGAMATGALLGMLAYLQLLGSTAALLSPLITLVVSFLTAPLIAYWTQGKYYIARQDDQEKLVPYLRQPHAGADEMICGICSGHFEREEMAFCPAYSTAICSLCCSLEVRCKDACKPQARFSHQLAQALRRVVPDLRPPRLDNRLIYFSLLMGILVSAIALVLFFVYLQVSAIMPSPQALQLLRHTVLKAFLVLVLLASMLAWWLVLSRESRLLAQEENQEQSRRLMAEIEAHELTDQKLQSAKEAAEAANQAKSRYVNGLSHELRTPLNSMLGYAQLLQRTPSLAAEHREIVDIISRNGSHLLSLINGLLDIARIEAGKLQLEVGEIDFPALIEQLTLMFKPQAQAKGLDFQVITADKMPAVVRGDEKRIRQILINLLGNALRYTSEGHVTLRIDYRLQFATFAIEDSGPGIDAAELERLFTPFERGSAGRSDGGLGLGLTISRMLTSLMGGEMNVTSQPLHGSCFTLRLFLPEVRVPQPRIAPEQDLLGYRGEVKRILIADDEREHRQLLDELLVPLGFDTLLVGDGSEVLDALATFSPDLILLDQRMPRMEGLDAARHIRTHRLCSAPIILISANPFSESGPEQELFNAHLSKPVPIPALLAAIGKWLSLEWIVRDSEKTDVPVLSSAPSALPPAAIEALEELGALGHIQSILAKLDELEALYPSASTFVEEARRLVSQFRLNDFNRYVRRARCEAK